MDSKYSYLGMIFIFVAILFLTSATIKNFQEIKTQQEFQMLALQQTLKLLQENK